jgi:CHAT domain-containing protein
MPRPLWVALGLTLLAALPARTAPPGPPVERELAAGEVHAYPLELAAGRSWLIAVEQRGIDVVVEVSGADGKRLSAVDAPLDRQGMEAVLVEPQAAGCCRVEVRAHEPAAPPGRYEIRVEELASGDVRLAALRALTRAGESYLEGTPEARRRALAAYAASREAWRSLGDRREEARALYAMAVVSRLVDDTRPALELGNEVLPLWQSLGDRLWEGATWNEIGLDRWLLGEAAEGRAAFERALAAQREAGDRYGEGASLSNLCLMDLSRGDLKAGLACYDRALPVLREVQAGALEASALLSAGRAWDVLGEPDQALARYGQARERLRATGNRLGEARTANQLGLLQYELGDYQEALARFGEALEGFRALDERRWQANVLHNMGLVYQSLGERPRALAVYEQALRLRLEVGDAKGEATTRLAMGEVNGLLGRWREALALDRQALALYQAGGDRWGEGVALAQIGGASLALGDSAAALAAFDRAVEILGVTGSPVSQADALVQRGSALAGLGEPAKGLESLRQALELARSAGYRAGEARVELAIARAERRRGGAAEARSHAEAALAILETLRTRIGSPDLRASYSALTHDAYELEVDLLMAAGLDRRALDATERARARTLLELLAEAGVGIHEGVDPALLARRAALLRRLSAKTERALRERPRNGAERDAREEERDAVLRDLDVVEAEIRERSPGYAALVQPRPLDAAGMQALLDADTLLLSYSLGKERSYLWAVTAKSVEAFELPGRAVLEAAARRYHEDLSGYDPADPADRARQARDGAVLARMLLGPVAKRPDRRRWVVVPDGALEYVPFGSLPLPGSPEIPVLERHEVAYLPSASALAIQRRLLAHRPPAPKRLLVLADPVFDGRDPRLPGGRAAGGWKGPPVFERLPGSRREAEAIAALASGGSEVVLDFDADRAAILGDRLRAVRTVHFATHGVIDAEHPALSGLALSMVDRSGRRQDGFLNLHDIFNLRLGADLVVLSGCRTALGQEVRGEGLIGLTRGFLYAGAPRVVASLWRVEDGATAALMARFYRALWVEGLRPAAALRAAQLSLRGERRWRDPYFWAAFVLEGDWE